jgi:hypothetical protein
MGTPPKTVDVTVRSRQSSRVNVNILTSAMLFPLVNVNQNPQIIRHKEQPL